MPVPLSPKAANGLPRRNVDILVIVWCISFLVMLASALPWFGPGLNWLGIVGWITSSALTAAVLGRHWKRRLPLRHGGNELRFEERPFAYHVCTLVLILFAGLMLFAGLVAAVEGLGP